MNVVYIKTFENGKLYVGITNNFEHRMRQHKCDAFTRNSQLPVHNAMRKYKHETEIVFQSENYDDVLKYEQIIIQNFKDLGIELYNITDGGQGTLGIEGLKGEKHYKSKPKEYYTNNTSQRDAFKTICNKQGWNFKHFKEIYSGEKIGKAKKYYYIYVGENNKDYGVTSKEKEYYSINSILRSNFKKVCKNNDWNFEDFDEVFSEWQINRDNRDKNKIRRQSKYYYIYKGE